MQGKPKGIKRTLAKVKGDLSEKIAISKYGEAGQFPQMVQLLESVHYLKWAHGFKKKNGVWPNDLPDDWIAADVREADELAAAQTISAILNNDAAYFDRMAAMIRHRRETAAPVDELGYKVALAYKIIPLQRKLVGKPQKTISANEIVKILTFWDKKERIENPPDYDPADIRRVMRALGLGGRG